MMRTITFFAALLTMGAVQAQNPLLIPDTLAGSSIQLNLLDTSTVFYNGFTTETYGVNGNYLGPTLLLEQGETVTLNVTNHLPDTTTVHWHGMHVSSQNDGGPHTYIVPGATWSPQFEVRDWATTFWYHPHLHHKTNKHVTLGAAGMIIVRDPVESALALPRSYGIDDFPLVLQSKAFDANKQITIGNAYDSVLMVNGTLNPYLDVPAQVVRFRVLNASTERVFRLGFAGNESFSQIGSDGGLLEAPVSLTRLQLGPGERAEIVVDLGAMQGQTLNLMNFGSEIPTGYYGATQPAAMGPGTITGYSGNVLNGNDNLFLQLNVGAATGNAITTIPATLVTHSIPLEADADQSRTLTLAPVVMSPQTMLSGPFDINNQVFDMMVVNQSIPLNNLEVWSITNQTAIAHPFHIHDVQFYILDIGGAAPAANMAGRKDVVLIPALQTVRFIARFETFCDSVVPYMYHCHMLTHEDAGMMGQFVVNCPAVGVDDLSMNAKKGTVFPNPTNGLCRIGFDAAQSGEYTLHNMVGQQLQAGKFENTPAVQLDFSQLSGGVYLLQWNTGQGRGSMPVVIQQAQ